MKKPPIVAQLAMASLLTVPAFAQNEEAAEEDVFELSPFVIDGSEDTGYRAKHSLSGSRMKISLDDITVPIDVITPEMMEDFNITEQEDMFDIVSNMETRGDDFLSGVYESGASYSIRGFVGVRSLRNFASSSMPFDRYNSTRFIASKGPNAILFGSGPGGGSVSFFTKRYNIGSKDRTNVSFTMDSNDSMRYEISGSRTLVEDKLGIFFAAFDDTRRYEIQPSYQARNGMYISGTYHPLENTVITASYESREEDVFRPASDYKTLIDNYTSWSDLYGQPGVLDTDYSLKSNGKVRWFEYDLDALDANGDPITTRSGGSYGLGYTAYADRYTSIDGQVYNLDGYAATTKRSKGDGIDQQQNWLVDGWNKDLGPTGLNGGAEVNNVAYDLNIEQKITDDLYLMLAYGKTDGTREQYQHRIRALNIDPNIYLPDGSENPYYGQYYGELTNYNFLDRSSVDETTTATLAYQLDLEEKNKYLGKHNFALMWSEASSQKVNIRQSFKMTADESNPDFEMTDVNLAQYNLAFRHYYGDDLSTMTVDDMMPDYRYIKNDRVYSSDGYTWELFDGVGSSGASDTVTTSNMFVAQSNFFRSRLITSFGYREEDIDQYVVAFRQNPDMQYRYTMTEHFTAEEAESEDFEPVLTNDIRPTSFPSIPYGHVDGISKNIGGVFKLTPDIALIANTATNISGAANRVGIFGQPLTNSAGESEDYGIRFNLFENKLRFEYNRYSTATTNQAYQSSRLKVPFAQASAIWRMMLQEGLVSRDVFEGGLGWDLRDFRSRGHELTISGSPIKGLSLRVAASYNEQVATNLGSEFNRWWNAGNGDAITAYATANPEATDNTDTSDVPENAKTYLEDINELFVAQQGIDGIPNVNQPLWAVKGLVKYGFRDGKLRGHETGLNLAWRSKQKSNFYRNADGSYDYDRPFYTVPTINANFFWNFKKKIKIANRDVNWKLQMNVSNLFNNQNVTDRNFFLTIRGDDTSEIVSNQVNMKEGRKVSITNSFSF